MNNNSKHLLRSNTKGYGGKLSRLTHEIAIQLHLVAESCVICSFRSKWPARKLLNTHTRVYVCVFCTRVIYPTKVTVTEGINRLFECSHICDVNFTGKTQPATVLCFNVSC
jgi:hypothetical protein